ncbi:hypothetical protein A8C56_14705 [Niabella ginsenosidivorans]|uniref:Uncharacterized protein n=1 Tax=Niabella ginsenosidivorans TaxID=1176587 RepID=A0A1A9I686_9BACT|nr:hypothetical protein [Niabella ginsenosidivorans]ANH82054.1 hypothetical protein A8C56_14705 [Niabella ginsenosidivorans]
MGVNLRRYAQGWKGWNLIYMKQVSGENSEENNSSSTPPDVPLKWTFSDWGVPVATAFTGKKTGIQKMPNLRRILYGKAGAY